MSVTACAHPNIALVKYWGKSNPELNLPAAGSLSITLNQFLTRTRMGEAAEDLFLLNGQPQEAARRRVFAWLDAVLPDRPRLRVESENNFPTAAGLASSASGFAALTLALDSLLNLNLSLAQRSTMARRGSGSAARSVLGGYVRLAFDAGAGETTVHGLRDAADWPLEVVVAVTESGPKAVSSGAGMNHSSATSPYYDRWVSLVDVDLAAAEEAIAAKDFSALADVSEASCLAMHAVMMASRPGLIYLSPATLAVIHRIRELRAGGTNVFFTVDAGPQVKAVCAPGLADGVAADLKRIAGVTAVHQVGLGPGAWVESTRVESA